jgi:hypothetical protein
MLCALFSYPVRHRSGTNVLGIIATIAETSPHSPCVSLDGTGTAKIASIAFHSSNRSKISHPALKPMWLRHFPTTCPRSRRAILVAHIRVPGAVPKVALHNQLASPSIVEARRPIGKHDLPRGIWLGDRDAIPRRSDLTYLAPPSA